MLASGMSIALILGALFTAIGATLIALGIAGAAARPPSFILGVISFVIGGVMILIWRGMTSSFTRLAREVSELDTLGVRRAGTVRDVVPYSSPNGGAVLHANGALLVVQIEVENEVVTCLLVEQTEAARQRIGKPITVIHHPGSPTLRAIEGYAPNGNRRAG